jgi:hypothetical protein
MEFLELAYDLPKDMHIPRRSNNQNKSARKYFYYQFMNDHPESGMSTAASTNAMREPTF